MKQLVIAAIAVANVSSAKAEETSWVCTQWSNFEKGVCSTLVEQTRDKKGNLQWVAYEKNQGAYVPKRGGGSFQKIAQ